MKKTTVFYANKKRWKTSFPGCCFLRFGIYAINFLVRKKSFLILLLAGGVRFA